MTSPFRSPYKSSVSPPLPPPKCIDLNSSTRSTDHSTGSKITRRAFHCDLVIENEGPETRNLLTHLGTPINETSLPEVAAAVDTSGKGDIARLPALLEELVKTERSYLSRIRALKSSYADPLRNFARKPESMIIPVYEAKTLFANIDQVILASIKFVMDLERATAHDIAEVCLKHLANGTLDPYRTYLGKQDESQRMFQDVVRKYPAFTSYIESTKYSTTGIGNIGLRELLMEPVQRIPRYTLLWSTMIKCYPEHSSHRTHLAEAIGIASKIAKCEPNEQTIRATVMYCLERNVEGFPANLFSNNRSFVDSIDVDEPDTKASHASTVASVSSVSTASSSATSGASNLHCTLFLFDDKLMIVKRQSSTVSGRKVTGLDDMQKLIKTGGGVAVMDKAGAKKDKLSFRGTVDILDIIATDVGNGEFNLFLERPPDQSERWSRQLRFFNAVNPPYAHLDPGQVKRDKIRFVENLWAAQAKARKARGLMSVELDLDEAFSRAKCYWSLFTAAPSRPGKVMMHVDEEGSSPDMPLGDSLLAFRVQAMPGGFTRFSYRTATGDEDRQVIDVSEVLEKTMSTIHKYGVYRFRTSTSSTPNTPTSSHRLRPSMLNLDTISRNLFGTGSVSSRGTDARSTLSSTRSRSIDSRISGDSSKKSTDFSLSPGPYRMADRSEVDLNERLNLARKNSNLAAFSPAKPPKSPLNGILPAHGTMSAPPSTTKSEPDPFSAGHIESTSAQATPVAIRRKEFEDREAEANFRASIRSGSPTPLSASAPLRIRNKSPSPVRTLNDGPTSPRLNGPTSPRFNGPRSPIGPRANVPFARSPSPDRPATTQPLAIPMRVLPTPTRPHTTDGFSTSAPLAPAKYPGLGSGHTRLRLVSGGGRKVSPGRETIPLRGEEASPPNQQRRVSAKRQRSEDHLQPRKRSDSRSPLIAIDMQQQPLPSLSPSSSLKRKDTTPRKGSNGSATPVRRSSVVTHDVEPAGHEDVASALESAKQRINEARVTGKRIKTELVALRKQSNRGSMTRSPQRRNITRLVDQELDFGSGSDSVMTDDSAKSLAALSDKIENTLRQAVADTDSASNLASRLLEENLMANDEIDRLREQVTRAKDVQDVLRTQLSDATTEIDVVYEAFNTELDGMYNDACLPETEAFEAMRQDLQQCKARRNELDLENQKLRRELEESNLKREQWARILREQGVLP